MKKTSKIALAATASVVVGALAFALPSLANDATSVTSSDSGSERSHSQMDRGSFASLSSTITGIPETVTDLKDAVKGAHFEIFRLEDGVTSLPATKPTIGGHIIGIRHSHNAAGNDVAAEIVNGSVTADLGFRASKQEGVTRFALYPSDGSAAVLVTVTTAADGTATAVASSALTVSYDATVAANAPLDDHGDKMGKGPGFGKSRDGEGHGPRGDRDHHGVGHDESADETVEEAPTN
jgi:hypothetical protein